MSPSSGELGTLWTGRGHFQTKPENAVDISAISPKNGLRDFRAITGRPQRVLFQGWCRSVGGKPLGCLQTIEAKDRRGRMCS